jgi:hypothetical protein
MANEILGNVSSDASVAIIVVGKVSLSELRNRWRQERASGRMQTGGQ